MNRFALLSVDDDECEQGKEEVKPITPSNSTEPTPEASDSWNDETFTRVHKKVTKKQVRKATPASKSKSIRGWQNISNDLLIYLMWEFLLKSPAKELYTIEKESFFALYWKCSLICQHWHEVLKSIQFWRKGTEKWGYGTQEQRQWISRQPTDQQTKYWMKLFRSHLHEEFKQIWQNRIDAKAAALAKWNSRSLKFGDYFVTGEVGEFDSRDLRRKKKFWSDD